MERSSSWVHTPHNALIEHGDKSLQLVEAFIVGEPIQQGIQPISSTFKHAFLVFALEPGQLLHGKEYRYMRVERQQQPGVDGNPPAPNQEALLNIRFCNTLLGAEALDIPGVEKPLTSLGLEARGVRECEHSARFTAERVTLGELLEIVMRVHNSQPTYSITGSNCIWFVEQILIELLGVAKSHEAQRALRAVLTEFRMHPRNAAAMGFGEVIEEVTKKLKESGIKGLVMSCLASKASAASAKVAGAGVAYKIKRATADAFAAQGT